jgi:small conductance mechanosensitive channel
MEELRAALSNWLDPQLIGAVLLTWSGRIVAALAIFIIGRIISGALTDWFRKVVRRFAVDETLVTFFGSVIYIVLLVLVALTAVAALGVPTTNFLVMLSAAGLAIGLALRDSLSNVASGVMIVFLRPFRVGDSIEAAGAAGAVEGIGIFSTIIKSPDNRVIMVPNRLVLAGTIVNASSQPQRRIDLTIPMTYLADVRKAKQLITAILKAEERALGAPPAEVALQDLAAVGVTLAVRVWVRTPDYANVRAELLERIKDTLEEHEIPMTVALPPLPPVAPPAAS